MGNGGHHGWNDGWGDFNPWENVPNWRPENDTIGPFKFQLMLFGDASPFDA